MRARLDNADLRNAHLVGTCLLEVDFSRVRDLSDLNLVRAWLSEQTRAPLQALGAGMFGNLPLEKKNRVLPGSVPHPASGYTSMNEVGPEQPNIVLSEQD